MTLRQKTLLIIGAALVVLIGALYGLSRFVLVSHFEDLEAQNARRSAGQVLSAISDDLRALDSAASLMGSRDDMYAFARDGNADYIQRRLSDAAFSELKLNLLLVIDQTGRLVWAEGFDLKKRSRLPVPKSILEEHLSKKLLWRHTASKSSLQGVLSLSEGQVLLLASRPILTGKGDGPIRGAVVMGRILDPTEVRKIARRTDVALTTHRFDDPELPAAFKAALPSLADGKRIGVQPPDNRSVSGFALLQDIYGKPALVLRANPPRHIYDQGRRNTSHFL